MFGRRSNAGEDGKANPTNSHGTGPQAGCPNGSARPPRAWPREMLEEDHVNVNIRNICRSICVYVGNIVCGVDMGHVRVIGYEPHMQDSTNGLYVAFGELIVAHRRRWKGRMTQAELGRRIGLSRTSVTNIEQGRHRVSLDKFLRIAAALEVSPEALLPTSPKEAGPSRMAEILPEGSPRDLIEWADSL